MGKQNRKFFTHNSVVFVTSSVREGLPLIPTSLFNFILIGILAKANSLYGGVRICHFVFMANHFHMLLVVKKQEDAPAFIGYVKQEISHTINRFLNRSGVSIWSDGYDSPLLLTFDKVIHYIIYMYLNSTKANLENSIEEFPGLSSWKMFLTSQYSKICKHIRRSDVPCILGSSLGDGALDITEQKRLLEALQELSNEDIELVIEPFAWVECFAELHNANIHEIKASIIKQIRDSEQQQRAERKTNKISLIGATRLKCQSILQKFQSKRKGKRMICIGSHKEHRIAFIKYFREICAKADVIYKQWKEFDLNAQMPPGLFAPHLPLQICALPICFSHILT